MQIRFCSFFAGLHDLCSGTKTHWGEPPLSCCWNRHTENILHKGRWISWEGLQSSLWHLHQTLEQSRVEAELYIFINLHITRLCWLHSASEGVFQQHPIRLMKTTLCPTQTILSKSFTQISNKMSLTTWTQTLLLWFVVYYQSLDCSLFNMQSAPSVLQHNRFKHLGELSELVSI